MKFYIILIYITLITFSCSSKRYYLKEQPLTPVDTARKNIKNCQDWESYIPDTTNLLLSPTRRIRVNFHVVQKADGTGNFNEEEGIDYIKRLLDFSNKTLKNKNAKMYLPKGNDTPSIPQRYQYVLSPSDTIINDDGIYFHRDEDLYFMIKAGKNKDYYKKDVIKKYAINKEKVLNIFLLEHPTDSLKSATFNPKDMGIAIGTSVKILGYKTNYDMEVNGKHPFREWFAQKLLHHEIGHVLGLSHSWIKHDRCDDTPPHPNCWNYGSPPCDKISNNVMDYNTYSDAWTPCQLGIIHKKFAQNQSRQRKLLIKDWCTFKESHTIHIYDTQIWGGAKDLSGHLIIHRGATLHIKCRVSLPKDAQIIIQPGATLVLENHALIYNDCGEKWDGIIIEQSQQKKGKVIMEEQAEIQDIKQSIHFIKENTKL